MDYLPIILSLPILLLIYIVYQLFIRIYIDAYRFQKMDPNLTLFIAPFFGLLGKQK